MTETLTSLRIERLIDAAREDVFAAWTQPEQIAAWYGPEGFETPVESIDIDPRPGGHLHLDMVQSATGRVFPNRYEILELVAPELLVLLSPAQPDLGLPTDVTVRLELHAEADGRTRLILTDGPYPPQVQAEAGWNMALDKLERVLAAGGR